LLLKVLSAVPNNYACFVQLIEFQANKALFRSVVLLNVKLHPVCGDGVQKRSRVYRDNLAERLLCLVAVMRSSLRCYLYP
jgi:hypothetical protein